MKSSKRFPDVRGKVLVVYCGARPEWCPSVLQNPSFQEQLGRLFLVGKVPRGTSENDWAAGRRRAIAWDSISEYVVFDNLTDYRRRGARKRKSRCCGRG